jgi:DEAD/DEAH box helicase domain-containing protein
MSELKEIFYDLETPRWSDEVEGGWSNISAFGMSVAVTWDDENGYRTWMEYDASELVKELNRADKIVGFNIVRFDHEVLSGYVPDAHELLDSKSFDIFTDLESRLGFRLSLEVICSTTLGKSKSGSGKDPIKWFRQGKIDELVSYCQRDVELTRDIYRYGQEHGFICYPRLGQSLSVSVDWGT